jgi:hypothetical protein
VTISFNGYSELIQLVVTCLFAAMKYVSFGSVRWKKKWKREGETEVYSA